MVEKEISEFTKKIYFDLVLNDLKSDARTETEKGRNFELFCKQILLTAPFFTDDVVKVWEWKEFPGNNNMHDTGIDLVVLDKKGEYWACQCKFYDSEAKVSKADIDSFISAASRNFAIDGVVHEYNSKVVFSTTENISDNASGLFTTIGPETLIDCGIDWASFKFEDFSTMKALVKKTPKPHQKTAIENVVSGFKNNNRGRLIMACGTGKTFTSLKIVEKLYEDWARATQDNFARFNILYLVPSIPLLSQTIIEWKTQSTFNRGVRTFGVCSDQTAGQDKKRKNRDEMNVLMPIPATTDINKIYKEYNKRSGDSCVNIFFSTYQSIDVISEFCKKSGVVFNIAICDEAHRTIGTYKSGDDKEDSNFVKIHIDNNVPCLKRLYMTATEKVYSSNAKQEADDAGWCVYSMDDEKVYGPVFYYLSFGEAVTQQLLTDYRLLVLNIRQSDIAKLKLPASAFENLDDSARVVGALSALSKIPSELNPDEFITDPKPMKRSVVFCSSIAHATSIAESFNQLIKDSCLGEEYMNSQGFVIPKAKLITGQDNTSEKNKKLNWLRDDIKDGECRILTNARCLSEGVDVPSLDSVIFMAKKRSQVDIIQAVGRVMRKFGSGAEKKYGYIIIPVVIKDEKLTDSTLSKNEEYKVVWQVVQALRSHDERLDTAINKVGVTGKMPESICFVNTFIKPVSKKSCVVGSRKKELLEGFDTDNPTALNENRDFTIPIPSDEDLKKNELLFSAQLVKHCGNRLYREDWSKNIGDVTNNIALKIKTQVDTDETSKKAFDKFLNNFKKLINPSITESDGINMLAEHIVTLPVLKAIFKENDLIDSNPVSQIMETMVKKLKGLENETKELLPFYESVEKTVEGVTSSEGRQEIIRKLFEKFFQYALPQSAEKFGIVYTPIEIVDFIINSVTDVLKNEFNESIINPGIKVLDPFTGTGTFIVRLLDKFKELGISDDDLDSKYQNDIWCNEIMLLAYYIALINIEDTFGTLRGSYKPFDHAVLTDTFQMAEKRFTKFYQNTLFEDKEFNDANKKAKEEDEANIRIIIGNPPYSVGQKSANDNNKNNSYVKLDERIKNSYMIGVDNVTNKKSLYDSYVRSFRWASDRLGDNGVLSFVSNGSYVDNLTFTGFRRELLKEFNHVYVYNLRGNCRSSGEFRKKEAGNVFGEYSRTLICIIVLVKHKGQQFDGFVHYSDIGDYLTKEQKLKIVNEEKSIFNIEWEEVYPDNNDDWINKQIEYPKNARIIGGKKTTDFAVFSSFYTRGITTGKDVWLYNFSKNAVVTNMHNFLKVYNESRTKLQALCHKIKIKEAYNLIETNPKLIKWTDELVALALNNKEVKDNFKIYDVNYRPFIKTHIYYGPDLIQAKYQFRKVNDGEQRNLCLVIPGIGNTKDFSVLISDKITDLGFQSACQCFPLYRYDTDEEMPLFGCRQDKTYAISDKFLEKVKTIYNKHDISKEDIFYYIYALFHSNEYKNRYENNLAKELPRITFVKNFKDYSNIGRKLAELHLNYENAKPYDGVEIKMKKEDYTVSKIRFASKDKKDTVIFNENITISNIPLEAYDYVVNGRSPIEWVMDQYQYTVDKDSGIIDDPNKFDENKGGKYIFDLILSLITVSLETLKLIKELPKYEEI